jgi:hypothetical protein
MKHVIASPLVSLAALGLAIALTGCGGLVDAGADRVEEAVENQVEEQLEEEAGVDVEFGENASLPDDFPESIPVPDGQIVTAIGTPDGWSVTYELASTAELDPVIDGLKSQGYTLAQELEQGQGGLLRFEGDEYIVTILVIVDVETTIAQYAVTPLGE